MSSKKLAAGVLGIEALALAVLGGLGYVYVKSLDKPFPQAPLAQPAAHRPEPALNQVPAPKFVEEYQKNGRAIADLAATISSRKDADLVMFVIDTSGSMTDDRKELRDSIDKILARYRGKPVQIINFGNTAEVTGDPTRDLVELRNRLDATQDLGGSENSLLALSFAAEKAKERFKKPLVVLMTDAAPNDGSWVGGSSVTIDQAANALNSANAELHVWAAFDNAEYWAGGSAATSDVYPRLVKLIKAGGQMIFVKRDGLDPTSLFR